MKPDREQCLKWAEESGFGWALGLGGMGDAIEALCQRVWNEAIDTVDAKLIDLGALGDGAYIEAIRELKK